MPSGKTIKELLQALIDDLDAGRQPASIRVPRWVRGLAVPAALGLSLGLGGCLEPQDGPTTLANGRADSWGDGTPAEESCPGPAEICDDGVDNDRDGFVDCFDMNCMGDLACNFPLYAAPSEQACADGVDNDGDGGVDCDDRDCQDNCVCEGPVEPSPELCGGLMHYDCPEGLACVDDPSDSCDPEMGGVDCVGICVQPEVDVGLCEDTCAYADDGVCDDGGPGAEYDVCELGTDCADCGSR